MQNNPNPLQQFQNLLIQLSNHVCQINEIIIQMNKVMNQINSPNFNQMNNLMDQMNGFKNCTNNINYNSNIPFFNQQQNLYINNNNNYTDLIYIKFNKSNGASSALNIDKKNTIAQLINTYLEKFGFKDNQTKFVFVYNGIDLEDIKEKKIEEILNIGSQITVLETKTFI